MNVRFVISRSASECSATSVVVLVVAIAGSVAHRRQRRAGVVVGVKSKLQTVRHSCRDRVAAVELERVRPIVAQQTAAGVVNLEVGVVICRVDVRVELTGRDLIRSVVVAGQTRPHVAGEELVVVAEALLRV